MSVNGTDLFIVVTCGYGETQPSVLLPRVEPQSRVVVGRSAILQRFFWLCSLSNCFLQFLVVTIFPKVASLGSKCFNFTKVPKI